MPRRTKEEAAQTREAILDAAELVFFEKGVSRSSLQEVAQAAGVTRGAVYWHFRDKPDLLDAMAQRVYLPQESLVERLVEKASDTPLDDLCQACVSSMRHILRDSRARRVFTIITQRCEYIDEMSKIVTRHIECKVRVQDRFTQIFERARRMKCLSLTWSPRIAAYALHFLLMGILMTDMDHDYDPASEKEGVAAIETFFKALRA